MGKTLNKPDDLDRMLETAHQWHVLLGDRDCSPEERAAFDVWVSADPNHADVYDRVATLGAAFQRLGRADIESDLLDEVRQPHRRPRLAALASTWNRRLGLSAAAAACLALLVLGPLGSWIAGEEAAGPSPPEVLRAEYTTGTAEIGDITLPDGTVVTMDARTSIRIQYSDAQRAVELPQGSAFFAVASDASRPFSVSSSSLTATALGTQFGVRSNAGVYRVAVSEGRVAVDFPFSVGGAPTSLLTSSLLRAGEAVVATGAEGLKPKTAIDASDVASWRSDRFVYRGASVEEFVADLNRNSDLPIEIDADAPHLGRLQISGVFRGREIERHLTSLSEIHPIEIDRSDSSKILLKLR